MDNTLDYYNKNADEFVQGTLSVDFKQTQDRFLDKLPDGAYVLDFGCGSGREFHIHLSGMQLDGQVRDGLERAVLLLSELSDLPANASKVEIKNSIAMHNDALKIYKE